MCCGYGTDGKGTKQGYDCVVIPGASKATVPVNVPVPYTICGKSAGLVTATGTKAKAKTVCSRLFHSSIFFTVQLCALHESVTSRHCCTSAVSLVNVLGTKPQGLVGTQCSPGKTQQTSRPLFGFNGEVLWLGIGRLEKPTLSPWAVVNG